MLAVALGPSEYAWVWLHEVHQINMTNSQLSDDTGDSVTYTFDKVPHYTYFTN